MQEIMEEKAALSILLHCLRSTSKRDYTETYEGESKMDSTEGHANSGSGLTVNSDTPQGQINKAGYFERFLCFIDFGRRNEDESSSTSAGSNEGTNSYTKRVKGNSGVSATAQKMIEQYRENIIMIDRDIIKI